jgi:PhzF family phenazine biosynthesis protein
MQLEIYQVDAFAQALFSGNPAAVIPLQQWLPDTTLQAIASENNLSETAFFVPEADAYRLRWFTPAVEVKLCGHATLASAHVLLQHLDHPDAPIRFLTHSGELTVTRQEQGLTLDFPAVEVTAGHIDYAVRAALGASPLGAYRAGERDMLYLFPSEAEVAGLSPDFYALASATGRCVIATAAGEACDFVSRFFAPALGIEEDPVTGSAHCALTPFWAARLSRNVLSARQISPRGGALQCELRGDRVLMTGHAVTFLVGSIYL